MSKKEREICSNESNDNIISALRSGLKTDMDSRCLVWKRVRKITFMVWNSVRIWTNGRHTPTKNYQDYLLRGPLVNLTPGGTAIYGLYR